MEALGPNFIELERSAKKNSVSAAAGEYTRVSGGRDPRFTILNARVWGFNIVNNPYLETGLVILICCMYPWKKSVAPENHPRPMIGLLNPEIINLPLNEMVSSRVVSI